MERLVLATTILLAATGGAFASDALASSPFTWTGGYVGVQTGYGWGDGSFGGGEDHANPQPQGFIGGFYAGANHQFGNNIVAGFEADVAWSRATDSALVYNSDGVAWPADYPVVQAVNRTGAARLRLGYAIGRWLPFAAGGVAVAEVDQRLVGADGNFDATYTGWTLGLGVEHAVTDNMIFRAEYRYADFGTRVFELPDSPALEIGLKTSDLRMGLAYRF